MRLIIPANRDGIHRTALTYFVRSRGLKSSFYLTTGTFNLFVKDLIRSPPERRFSGLPDFKPASSKLDVSLDHFRLPETNLLILPRHATACQAKSSVVATFLLSFFQATIAIRDPDFRSTRILKFCGFRARQNAE